MFHANDKFLIKLSKVLFIIFIAVLSVCVFSKHASKLPLFTASDELLDENKNTVIEFSVSSLALSVAITFLPDDIASPVSNTLSDISKYCVLILVVIFLEKLMLSEGVRLAFTFIVPLACLLFIIFIITENNKFKELSKKILILSLMMIFMVPLSSAISNSISENYMEYVDETIDDTTSSTDKLKDIKEIQSIGNVIDYFKDLTRRCINSVSILIVVSFAIPLLTFLIFVWALNQIFSLNLSVQSVTNIINKGSKEDEE